MNDKRLRIVIADDEPIIRLDLKKMLEDCGYDVVGEAGDGVRALEAARNLKPDVIILDIKMPEMDGIAFAKKIRFILPDMPILFMTGHVSDELREEAFSLGNVEFLEKPFPLESTLKEVIPKFLGL